MKSHGDSKKRLYRIYRSMVSRCGTPSDGSYKNYGAKGVSVCNEWLNGYEIFKVWAIDNGYKDTLTIDRIDSSGNYQPNNCQWITQHEQVLKQDRNKDRTANDLHIYKRGVGYVVEIIKGTNTNRVVLLRQQCSSKEEAVKHRDYFMDHGEALEYDNGYTENMSVFKKKALRKKRRQKETRLKMGKKKKDEEEKLLKQWVYTI